MTSIQLPAPSTEGKVPLERAIADRRSVRGFSGKELDLAQIGQLAWAAQGITDAGRGYRSSPSAGALYPLEIYLVTHDGAYHYEPEKHVMTLVTNKDLRGPLADAALHQHFIEAAPLSVVIAAVHRRVTPKYGVRGIRYAHIDVGHAAQNVLLEAVAMGLGAVPVGAFRDEAVKQALALPAGHEPVYIISVGHAAA